MEIINLSSENASVLVFLVILLIGASFGFAFSFLWNLFRSLFFKKEDVSNAGANADTMILAGILAIILGRIILNHKYLLISVSLFIGAIIGSIIFLKINQIKISQRGKQVKKNY